MSVVDIARTAGTSPATFYQYFKDVCEATLRLAEQAADEMPEMLEIIAGSWEGEQGLERARRLVDAFVRHWDEHRAVLLVRNLAADEGDRRFLRVRQKAMTPVLARLAEQVIGGPAGRPRRSRDRAAGGRRGAGRDPRAARRLSPRARDAWGCGARISSRPARASCC